MNLNCLVIFFLLIGVVQIANCTTCAPNICELVDCPNVSLELCKGPNKMIKKDPCGCCNICYTYLNEGETCSDKNMNSNSGCKLGLVCENGRCNKNC
ncbi:hypothetical protein WA026_016063 [Henosepilachna vigintioctopunctata]|uniref:Uncharacterized protein n=1 Tax=Henosepilachna vigintioctopunctata TaxID=420089 RepID=A0AAW1UAT4_9CUCU